MPKKISLRGTFINGILAENPTFRLVLGTCPTIAVTTSAINGVGMGLAATFVLIGSNVVISMLRNFIPSKVRIPAFVVVICTFVTMIELFMHAFLPSLYNALGIFLPLIVVNCIISACAKSFDLMAARTAELEINLPSGVRTASTTLKPMPAALHSASNSSTPVSPINPKR